MTTQYRANRTKAALLSGETIAVPEIIRVCDPIVVELIAEAGFNLRLDRYGALTLQFGQAIEHDFGGANCRP